MGFLLVAFTDLQGPLFECGSHRCRPQCKTLACPSQYQTERGKKHEKAEQDEGSDDYNDEAEARNNGRTMEKRIQKNRYETMPRKDERALERKIERETRKENK